MKLFLLLTVVAGAWLAATSLRAADTGASAGPAARTSHRIVFELAQAEPEAWNALLNNVENLRKALGESATQVEIVAHGKGLDFLKASNAAQKERMQKLAEGGVVFAACENTMRRQKVTKADLLPFATTVDSGVAEIVRKQEDRWSYIRSGN